MPTEEIISQNFESMEQIPDKNTNISGQPKNRKKILILGLSGFVVLLLLLTLVAVTTNKKVVVKLAPTPEPTATPTPLEDTITSPSVYATDSAVLKIGSDINDLQNQLQNIDLKDNNLLPPAINLNINLSPN